MPRIQTNIQGYAATLLILLITVSSAISIVKAQVIVYEDFVPEKKFIYKKEWAIKAYVHTGGVGIGFEQGWFDKKSRFSGWNIEALTQWHPKRIKILPFYPKTRSYVNGMLAEFGMLRGGYGGSFSLHEKPFWGGVQVLMFVNGGFSLGLRFPQYLYVKYNEQDPETLEISEIEVLIKNDPDADVIKNKGGVIYGRGPWFSSWKGLRPYPGIYAKTGFAFEFGTSETKTHTLEVGASYDFYFAGITLFAKTKAKSGFLNFFLAYRYGKRSGIR
jgi:hypothetical protein